MSVDESAITARWRMLTELVEAYSELEFIGQLIPELEQRQIDLAAGFFLAVILPLDRLPAYDHDELGREIILLQDREAELDATTRRLERLVRRGRSTR